MFERLSEGFSGLLRKLSGQGTISESNVRDAMEDVRTALLEADVHVDVVRAFCERVLADAVGRQVTASLRPGEEMIGIVHEQLVEFLGGVRAEDGTLRSPEPGVLSVSPGPTIVMMCGLQGSGKTTTCGKLAAYLARRGRSVMLCAADLQRPAAVEQLQTVAETAQRELPGSAAIAFYGEPERVRAYGQAVGVAVGVCQRALGAARARGIDTLILDTAGRLHIDDALMGELGQVNETLRPHQIFLVVDAMTGQDAVRSARAFHERLEVDGLILTKFDSDTRGGAALSAKHVTGAPIRFIGVGEKLDALEEFHAERIAGRILGMGDVVSLVEKAREQVSDAEAERMQEKLAKGQLTMDDFLSQLRALRRMGPMKQLLALLPGVGPALKDLHIDDKQLDRIEGMVHSMTPRERRDSAVLNQSRRRRIASGSGTQPEEVSQLVRQFAAVGQMTRSFAGMSPRDRARAMKDLGPDSGSPMLPGGIPGLRSRGSTHTESIKSRFKKRRR